MTSLYSLGDTGDWDYYDEASHNFSASVDKFVGRHSLRAGFDYRQLATVGRGHQLHHRLLHVQHRFAPWESTAIPASTWRTCCSGCPLTARPTLLQTLTDKIPYYAWFVQDNFRVTSKLTINMGIRWEHEGGVQEANNGLLTWVSIRLPRTHSPRRFPALI